MSGVSQEMIEAGIAALGSDDDRATAEKVLDVYNAMGEARSLHHHRDVGELVLGLRVVRSLIHNLPRSATAERIDQVCADALGEPRTP